jgi:hypothetical protein
VCRRSGAIHRCMTSVETGRPLVLSRLQGKARTASQQGYEIRRGQAVRGIANTIGIDVVVLFAACGASLDSCPGPQSATPAGGPSRPQVLADGRIKHSPTDTRRRRFDLRRSRLPSAVAKTRSSIPGHQQPSQNSDHRHRALLRPRHQRPSRRPAEPCNKFAPSHPQSSSFKIGAVTKH